MNVWKCVCFVTSTARLSKCLTTVICPLEAAAWRGLYPRLSLQLISAPWATSRHTTSKWPAAPEHACQQKAAIDCSCHFCCSVGFFFNEICSCGKIIDPFCNALKIYRLSTLHCKNDWRVSLLLHLTKANLTRETHEHTFRPLEN